MTIKKFALVILACSQPAIAGARPVIIPAKFHGEFNSAQQFCGTGLSDTRLRISANKIRFYESEGTPKSILTQPNGEITVLAEGLTLALNAGEIHAIMGPNGAGKSTLGHVLPEPRDYIKIEGHQ